MEITLKMLVFTSLRNQSYGLIKVKDVNFEKNYLHLKPNVINSKNQVRIIPLPPKFVKTIRNYVKANELKSSDFLCLGMSKNPLKNKMLNFLTNKIGETLGWRENNTWHLGKEFTPHGFRYTIATILAERNVIEDHIEDFLGHDCIKNVKYYKRNSSASYKVISNEITRLEVELENSLLPERERETVKCETSNITSLKPTSTKIATYSLVTKLASITNSLTIDESKKFQEIVKKMPPSERHEFISTIELSAVKSTLELFELVF